MLKNYVFQNIIMPESKDQKTVGRKPMFRIWGKLIKDNRLLRDTVICIDDFSLTRTQKVYKALEEICYEFDLAKPVWLKKNQEDFIKHARCRFTNDNFIENIEFDYLDFQVIEEEY
jgi:hypothetical protein